MINELLQFSKNELLFLCKLDCGHTLTPPPHLTASSLQKRLSECRRVFQDERSEEE